MKKIYKYTLRISDEQEIEIPDDSEILSVQMQSGEPQIWVLVNPENYTMKRRFKIYGTGHDVEDGLKFIGTFQSGPFVWHLFEVMQ